MAQYEDDDLIQGSLQLLDKYYIAETDLFVKANQTELLVTKQSIKFCNKIESSILSSLRDYLNMKDCNLHHSVFSGYSPLQELTQKCWLDGEVVGTEPHQQNQKIIYNFGELRSSIKFMCTIVTYNYSILLMCMLMLINLGSYLGKFAT